MDLQEYDLNHMDTMAVESHVEGRNSTTAPGWCRSLLPHLPTVPVPLNQSAEQH